MDSQPSQEQSTDFCTEAGEIVITRTSVKRNYLVDSCSETIDENYDASTMSLNQSDMNSATVLDCASNGGSMPLVSVDKETVKMVDDKEQVIMINSQASVIIDSQGNEVRNDVKIEFEPSSSASHQDPSYEENDSVSSNYFVLVENSDGSQVISGVIPNILPASGEQSQLSLNAVLPSGISYINSSAPNQGKEQAGYSTNSVTMVLDPSLHPQDSQKIFIEPSSLISIESQAISPEQLAIIEKGSEQPVKDNIANKNVIIHSNESSLSQNLHSIQVSSLGDNSSQSQMSLDDTEMEMKSFYMQRHRNLQLLVQSHLEHQNKLLNGRNEAMSGKAVMTNEHTERLLKEAGIDDSTPIFSYISAKVNPEILMHVPGCQKFLLSEAACESSSTEVSFTSEMDCSFTGDLKDFVALHSQIKRLLQLCSSTNLILEKGSSKKQNKSINCNLLVPYVSSKGRISKQSSKLMQMGGILGEYLSGEDIGDKDEEKRPKRGQRKRRLLYRNRYKRQTNSSILQQSDHNVPELHHSNEQNSSICEEVSFSPAQEEAFGSLDDDNKLKRFDPLSTCAVNKKEENTSDVAPPPPDLTLMDPVQRRLLEEQLKCKQMHEDSTKLKQLNAMLVSHSHQKQFPEGEGEGGIDNAVHDDENPSRVSNTSRRRNKGRPPKKFDPSETTGKVKPRNPLTESAETKQRRIYEEHVAYKFFCNQCSFKSKRQSQFNNHLRCHEKGKGTKYYCRHCDFISISVSAFKRHELVHKRNVLKCKICNVYVTDKKSLMQKHLKLKHSPKALVAVEKKFPCSECSATFANRIALGRHQTGHLNALAGETSETTDNVCPQCKKSFGKKIHLHRHMRDIHGPEKRPHLCDTCGMSFKRKDALQQHQIVHVAKSARVLPFKCNKCDKAFRSQAHLKEHSSIHSTERPFLCQYCGSSFKTQPVQKKHILTLHIQPRTHVCAVCCRQFNTKNALQRHENTHKAASSSQVVVDEGIQPWVAGGMSDKEEKIDMKDNSVMVSLEEDEATTALVVEAAEGSATQVMVDPSLGPAIIVPNQTHSSTGARTLDVQQALIQGSQADQAFYYLTDDQLQTIQ